MELIKKYPLRFIFFLAIFVRLFLPVSAFLLHGDLDAFMGGDSGGYIDIAQNLISTHSFIGVDGYEISRTPLYPFFIVPAVLLNCVVPLTILFQIILSSLSVIVIYYIAMMLFDNKKIAFFSSFIYLFEPLSILYCSELMSETLFSFMLILSVYFLLAFYKKPTSKNLLGTSLFLVLSYFVRPISIYLPFVYAFFIVIKVFSSSNKKILLLYLLVFLVVSISPRYMWQYRNYSQTGVNQFSVIGIKNIYFYKAAAINARKKGIPYYQEQKMMGYHNDDVYFSLHPQQKKWSKSEVVKYWYEQGKKIITDDWLIYARIHFDGAVRILFDPGATEFLKLYKKYPHSGGLLGVLVDKGIVYTLRYLFREMPFVFFANLFVGIIHGLLLLLFILSLFDKMIWSRPVFYILVCISGYLLMLSAGPAALNRFRHPIMPIICLWAGYGLYKVYRLLQKKNWSVIS